MPLFGSGQYNLNALKEIRVTDSYRGLDQDIKGCQDEEPILNCKTRHYIDSMLKQCGCLPFRMMKDKVITKRRPHVFTRSKRNVLNLTDLGFRGICASRRNSVIVSMN